MNKNICEPNSERKDDMDAMGEEIAEEPKITPEAAKAQMAAVSEKAAAKRVESLGLAENVMRRLKDKRYREGFRNASKFLNENGANLDYHGLDKAKYNELIVAMFTQGTEDDTKVMGEIIRSHGEDVIAELRDELKPLALKGNDTVFMGAVRSMSKMITKHNTAGDIEPEILARQQKIWDKEKSK